jgi:trans-aconitate methyltransferase
MERNNSWKFRPVHQQLTAFADLPPRFDMHEHSLQQNESEEYYGASFPADAYAQLRRYVQTEGWNTLLTEVTFKSGINVVDLGFGDGGNTAQLASYLSAAGLIYNIFGIDLSDEMVESANAKYPKSEYPNLIFAHGKAEEAGSILDPLIRGQGLNDEQASIDLVLSNYTLHWVRDHKEPTKFLHKEMFRQLNPLQPIGGQQRHFCAHEDAFSELFDAGYELIKKDRRWGPYFIVGDKDYTQNGEWRHPPLITKEAMQRALEDSGYQWTTMEVKEEEREFPSKLWLKEWVKTMIRPFMNRIAPPAEKEEFARAWIDLYLNQTNQDGRSAVKLWDRNLLVVARKSSELADSLSQPTTEQAY